MNHKSKGSNAERELVNMFWKAGWASLRVAGSGSAPHTLPDIVAGNGMRRLAIECKATSQAYQGIKKKQAEDLQKFAHLFGAEAWVGIRFDNEQWYFLMLEDLLSKKNAFSADLNKAKLKGLLFEELIGVFRQKKLGED